MDLSSLIIVVFTRDGVAFLCRVAHDVCPTKIASAAIYFLIKQFVPGVRRFQYRTAL